MDQPTPPILFVFGAAYVLYQLYREHQPQPAPPPGALPIYVPPESESVD